MKKILIILAVILLGLSSYADGVKLTGEAQFDWVDMSQIQRDSTIEHYKNILFGDDGVSILSKSDFEQKFAPFMKDENYKLHYSQAKSGMKENDEANICAFFFKKDILLIYALQYKDNLKNVYYYNAYGHLQYVDVISDNYPNFPYNSKQYRKNGKLVSAIYFTSPDIQYMFEPDGDFIGIWYKEKMYDKNGKQTVKRTNWGI